MSHPSELDSSLPTHVIPSDLRKHIRSKATKAFVTDDGHWTNQLQSAASFLNPELASEAVQSFKLREVELYGTI
jgi:hypothetical protein